MSRPNGSTRVPDRPIWDQHEGTERSLQNVQSFEGLAEAHRLGHGCKARLVEGMTPGCMGEGFINFAGVQSGAITLVR